jgi:hypothetical protein
VGGSGRSSTATLRGATCAWRWRAWWSPRGGATSAGRAPRRTSAPSRWWGVARARSVTRSVTADFEAHAWLHLAPSRADRAEVTACVVTRCPVDDLRWSLGVGGRVSEQHVFPAVAAGPGPQSVCATVRERHPPGPFEAELVVTRGADVVARAQDSSLLGPACVDRDGDGACLADGFPGDRPRLRRRGRHGRPDGDGRARRRPRPGLRRSAGRGLGRAGPRRARRAACGSETERPGA